MGKRDKLGSNSRGFSRNDSNKSAASPLAQFAGDMFQIGNPDIGEVYINADPIALHDISPDPAQPRRAVPTQVRQRATPATANDRQLFDTWLLTIAEESGDSIDLTRLFAAADAADDDEPFDALNVEGKISPVKHTFIELLMLAYSIRRDGLANPITVFRKPDGTYQIESGERRWMAYWLLRHYDITPDKWQHIPAIVADHYNPFRQASENMARANLNAIGRARQYAVLLMAMHPDEAFMPYEQAATDRAYYAQVVERKLKVPYGNNKALLEAFGIRSRSVFSKLRQVLEVADDIWVRADDENWSEDKLFTVMNNVGTNSTKSAATTTQHPLADRTVRKRFNRVFRHLQNGVSADIPEDDLNAIEQWLQQVREAKQAQAQ